MFEIDSSFVLVEQEKMPFFFDCKELENSIFRGMLSQSFLDNLPFCELKNLFCILNSEKKPSPIVSFIYGEKKYNFICYIRRSDGDWMVDVEVWQDNVVITNYKVTCLETYSPEATMTLYKKSENEFTLKNEEFMFYFRLLS